MKRLSPIALACTSLPLGACVPQVALAPPPQVASGRWSDGAATAAAPVEGQRLAALLNAPELARLTEQALRDNADLAAAAARVEQARAAVRLARSEAQPSVTGGIGLRGTRSDDTGTSAFRFSAGSASLDVAWEIDLFGRLSAARRAERARFVASAFDRDALALSVEAELARAFIQHIALGERIALLDRNLQSARELERIIATRRRLGAATRVDTGLQAVEVRQLEVERTRLVEAQRRTRTALSVLAGAEPPLFSAPVTALDELTVPAPAGVQPAELLVRRADLRAAEARIAAAAGDVSAARRAFLPQLRISASALGQAASLTGPVGATLAIGADLLGTIFNRGRLLARLDAATAAQRESVELYRGAILQALREAEDGLGAADQSRQRALLLDQIVEEARTTARLARLQYVEGYADLQRVIEAESRLIAIEDARVVAVQERLEAAVDLFRAMGGSAVPAVPRVAAR